MLGVRLENIRNYIFFSFMALVFLSYSFLQQHNNSLDQLFFLTTLVVIHYFCLNNWLLMAPSFDSKTFSAFVVVESAFILAAAGELHEAKLLFLSLIPVIMGLTALTIENLKDKQFHPEKKYLFTLICGCVFLSIKDFYKYQGNSLSASSYDYSIYGACLLWSWGTIQKMLTNSNGYHLLRSRGSKNHYKKSSLINGDTLEGSHRIYHDLVSQLHNSLLFLGQKMKKKQSLQQADMELLHQELVLMMNQFKYNFNYHHRHIPKCEEIITFSAAKKNLLGLIQNLLPEGQFQVHILAQVGPETECFVHFPNLHRIFLNLLLNIAENKASQKTSQKVSEVEISFGPNSDGLNIQFKNKIMTLKEMPDLTTHLKKIILGDGGQRLNYDSSHGLDSVSQLCEEMGGRFDFEIAGDYWISKVSLPNAKEFTRLELIKPGSKQAA